ncbi:hypothetical protein [Microvirga tunisiensis]|uniref:Uncharacterized protein n=1 Tax=Microvirga tunisiensis TaxID=2108360 RepID=A0A5N7MJC0_9HYPH|nr:hypothetical protein [Microvirga tunisiensis]MPR08703.1 hypothetical protein [Microvirga tunisiensis]MPR26908.1 hypothetical protein [Microvirga tunisiensis]
MAPGRTGQTTDQPRTEGGGNRPVNLQGDSPEVVAFALLRYLAQLEQPRARQTGVVFDREWLLNAYADCLAAVKGERPVAAEDATKTPAKSAKSSGRTR